MKNYFKNYHVLIGIALALSIILGIFVFLYPTLKPVPIGSDANIYLNDAKWIANNQTALKPYQETYHGFYAYTAPFTDLNIVLLNQFTGLNRTYPLLSIYQLYLVILLVLSSYLLGKIYNNLTSLLTPIALLGSFAIIRLFVGSTISNLLAFVFINIIYYCFYKYFILKKNIGLLVIFIFLISLFLTHNYLSAPIFLVAFIFYLLLIFNVNKTSKLYIVVKLKEIKKYIKVILFLIVGTTIVLLFLFYSPVIREAIKVFWRVGGINQFIRPVKVSEYGSYLGQFIFIIGILGIIFYILNFKKNILSVRALPLVWTVILLILLQTYRLGINFYYERIIFLAGVIIAFYAAYYISIISKIFINKRYVMIIIGLFIVFIIVNGATRVKTLFDNSNLVTKNQIKALELLQTISHENDKVFSHINAVSQTNHDNMISDRDIIRLSTAIQFCTNDDIACQAFNKPEKLSSIVYFKENNIKYFLFMRPSYQGGVVFDNLVKKYSSNTSFSKLYISNDAYLFGLNM